MGLCALPSGDSPGLQGIIGRLDLWPRAPRPPAPPTHCVQTPAALAQACEIDQLILFLLQKVPELKFKYVEEEQPEEFFIPYVWSLVYNSAVGLYWNPQDIQLFTMDSD